MSLKTSLLNYLRRFFANESIDRRFADWLGNHENSFWIRRVVPGPTLYPKGSERTVRRFGVDFRLDISDYQDWSIYFYNPNDNSRSLLNYIGPGNVVIDVGGNVGQTALWIAEKTGPGGQVISFEPFPKSIAKFEFNHSLNKSLSNLKLVKSGLGSEAGTLVIQEDSRNSGANRIASGVATKGSGLFEIEITTLDQYLEGNPLSNRVDFIKIDVEGYEMHVLNGARRTIEKYHPTLFIEVDDEHLRNQGASAEDLLQFVRASGYTIIDTVSGNDLSVSGNANLHTDILCIFDQS